ncbi:hypothetical protein BDY19DRAFT_989836 [Irpex rosettiformis]|uniref:Uncharacterized protein n=1 Tax=Irpex rosettiformis TaxID=378272 RepID=A0ACB8UFX1_9APHY|nr:hypothetical protein BDY19DRAFT_989836 [Irpex rosettiformis]
MLDLPEHKKSLVMQGVTSIPTYKLPPELLCLIFQYCAPPETRSIAFSQVSRYWRRTALDCPQLWRTPLLKYPDLAAEMAVRAKGIPLRIRAHLGYYGPSNATYLDTLEDILKQSAVEYFELDISYGVSQLAAGRLLDLLVLRSNTTLRHLSLHSSEFMSLYEIATPIHMRFPNLHQLHFNRCIIDLPWHAEWYDSLVVLQIDFADGMREWNRRMTTEEVSGLLRRSRKLKRLSLGSTVNMGVRTDQSSPLHQFTEQICLPYLTSLELRDTPYHLLALFSLLEVPALTKLVVRMRDTVNLEKVADAHTALQFIVDKIVSAPNTTTAIESLKFQISLHNQIFKATCHSGRSSELQVSFYVLSDLVQDPQEIWMRVLNKFSLDKLDRFTIKVSQKSDIHLIRPLCDLLAAVPLITKAVFIKLAYIPFIESLASNYDSHFSAMDRLYIMSADLTAKNPVATDDQQTTGLQRLAMALRSLKTRGRPIAKVVLRDCTVDTPATDVFDMFDVEAEIVDEEVREHAHREMCQKCKGGIFCPHIFSL